VVERELRLREDAVAAAVAAGAIAAPAALHDASRAIRACPRRPQKLRKGIDGASARAQKRAMRRLLIAAFVLACAPRGHWPPRPAEHPPTRIELQIYELTVRAPSAEERAQFAEALRSRGFAIVDHEPFKGHLEVTLTHEADSLVATLRSDGWFVDEAVGKDVDSLAATLAVSQRLTDFIRNSGLPQQHMVPEQ
jgi:hypothetical protein